MKRSQRLKRVLKVREMQERESTMAFIKLDDAHDTHLESLNTIKSLQATYKTSGGSSILGKDLKSKTQYSTLLQDHILNLNVQGQKLKAALVIATREKKTAGDDRKITNKIYEKVRNQEIYERRRRTELRRVPKRLVK